MKQLPQLEMERSCSEALPEVRTPTGYSLRTFRSGDEASWCRLVNEAIGGEYMAETMRSSLLSQPWFDEADLFFAEQDGIIVGTVCAQRERVGEDRTGVVHMLAVDPAHRDRGLGRALVAAAVRRLQEVGCRTVALSTDDFRLSAIHLYLQFGFRPNFTHDSHAGRWREVRGRLALCQGDMPREGRGGRGTGGG